MKKHLLPMLLCLASLTAGAYEFQYLTLETTEGSSVNITCEKLEMKVDDSQSLIVSNAEGTQTFKLSTLEKMYFSGQTGTDAVITVADGPVTLYSTAGVCLGSYENIRAAVADVAPGVYVVKANGLTSKISVK